MIIGREPKALNVINNLGLWITRKTQDCELKALNAMNSLGLWLT